MAPILILGIGNILLRDEGAGVHAVRRILETETLPENVEAFDGGTGGIDLIEIIAGRDKVIVIDAMKADELPGTIYRFTGQDLMDHPERSISLHEFGLSEVLLMARQLNCAPREVIIYGIQPGVMRPPGLELSEAVEKVLPKVIQAVLEEAKV